MKSIAIIKLQILILAMVVAAFISFMADPVVFFLIQGALTIVYLFLMFKELKIFKEDYKAHAVFFGVVLLFILAASVFPFLELGIAAAYYAIVVLLAALVAFAVLFMIFFGRKYTQGTVVVSDSDTAVVRTEYDLLALTNSGEFVVKSKGKAKKGSKVRVRVKQGLFRRKPVEIV